MEAAAECRRDASRGAGEIIEAGQSAFSAKLKPISRAIITCMPSQEEKRSPSQFRPLLQLDRRRISPRLLSVAFLFHFINYSTEVCPVAFLLPSGLPRCGGVGVKRY